MAKEFSKDREELRLLRDVAQKLRDDNLGCMREDKDEAIWIYHEGKAAAYGLIAQHIDEYLGKDGAE